MKVANILKTLDNWIIPQIKWDNDSIGLQVGDKSQQVSKIMLAVNPTPEVMEEAAKKNCELVITHHPLFYHPMKRIVKGDFYADTAIACIKNNISYAAYHTNLDLVKDGVSFALARELNLSKIEPLVPLSEISGVTVQENYKITVYVPASHADKIKKTISASGGGTIGDYDYCFFESEGKGSFRPGNTAKPYLGKQGEISNVDEIKIETIVPGWQLDTVISEMIKTHPYEEPAYDIYKLENSSKNFGLGSIGELENEMNLEDFLNLLKETLGTENLRIAIHDKNQKIKRVAVAGGSCAGYWREAHTKKADIYLSSEFDHHTYLEAKRYLNIVDASHHATEQFAVKRLQEYLSFHYEKINIEISETDKDPVSDYFHSRK